MKIKFILLIFCFLLSGSAFSQSAKEIRKFDVYSKKTWNHLSDNKKVLQLYEKFDTLGNTIEIMDYDKDGKFQKHIKYTYNVNNDKIKEVYLDKDGNIVETVVYTYDEKLRTSKKVYNSKNTLISKKTYEYEFIP
ncbi:MAG: hypothetical protein JXJ22_09210 [Bacteroidales bacterium]|nr:hypothetical protein [Bacteroidales bacterium]